jgi:hypothetical protein
MLRLSEPLNNIIGHTYAYNCSFKELLSQSDLNLADGVGAEVVLWWQITDHAHSFLNTGH